MKKLITLFVFLCPIVNLFAQEISFPSPCDTLSFCVSEDNCGPTLVELNASATTTCTMGTLVISYTVDLDDDGTIEASGAGSVVSGNYPVGSHRVVFTATDDCSNEAVCDFVFLVADCTPPTAMAYNGLLMDLQENCLVAVDASQFNLGSTDNCGIDSMLLVTPSQGIWQNQPPAEAVQSVVFDCSYLGTNTVDFWVSDEAGNWSYFSTYILVQDNVSPLCSCQDFGSICLFAETECGEPIDQVSYQVEPTWLPGGIWNEQCNYNLSLGGNFIVTLEKDINPFNGLSTFDVVLMAKHILGVETLDSPYKIIAADINHSGSVSVVDLVALRRLILYIDTEFSNNTSWRFVDADFVFPNPLDPFQTPVPDICVINGLSGDVEKTFIGIKIGDLHKSADPGFLIDPNSEDRNEAALTFELDDQRFEAGETVSLDFYAEDIDQFSGFQFDLNFDPEYLGFEHFKEGTLPQMNTACLGLGNVEQGSILASWVNSHFAPIEKTTAGLFTLQFKALQAGTLKDVIKMAQSRLSSEAYTNDLKITDLNIHFSESVSKYALILESNPNPFQENTTLRFELRESGSAILNITDLEGKKVFTIQQHFEKGWNEINVSAKVFLSNGLYFCHLKSSTESAVTKLLKI